MPPGGSLSSALFPDLAAQDDSQHSSLVPATWSGFLVHVPPRALRTTAVAIDHYGGGTSTSFLLNKCGKKPQVLGPKICWHYPGEDTSVHLKPPPEDTGIHAMDMPSKAWEIKKQKFSRIACYFLGGLAAGGIATAGRIWQKENCPPESVDWDNLFNFSMSRLAAADEASEADQAGQAASSSAGAAAAAGAAAGRGGKGGGRGKAKAAGKPKAKPKPKPKAAPSDSDEDSDSG
eukprot:TRINITY_DN33637_c0_g1_i1.p1 TRINITY_DN33637_c0_g1~~TRINITY_DN33637_c0_g1_i1.p1  ORF type:complete len:233 (+),score=38.39 TRINITY_DN33637_c0_g1_i1:100-798(+)